MGFYGLFKVVFSVQKHFLPPLVIALSVVSMELWSPHKMVEIRPRHSNKGNDDRVTFLLGNQHSPLCPVHPYWALLFTQFRTRSGEYSCALFTLFMLIGRCTTQAGNRLTASVAQTNSGAGSRPPFHNMCRAETVLGQRESTCSLGNLVLNEAAKPLVFCETVRSPPTH